VSFEITTKQKTGLWINPPPDKESGQGEHEAQGEKPLWTDGRPGQRESLLGLPFVGLLLLPFFLVLFVAFLFVFHNRSFLADSAAVQ
jgi:hypothetical protein